MVNPSFLNENGRGLRQAVPGRFYFQASIHGKKMVL